MDGRFGARLRQRREEQGIDLIAIAAQTKIKMSLLDALERDDVTHWPSGIFRRAYIRAYAQAIGLDPDTVVREFLEVHPEPEEIVTTETIAAAVESRVHTGPPTRLRYIFGSAMSSLARLRRGPAEESAPSSPEPRVALSVPPAPPVLADLHEAPEPMASPLRLDPVRTPEAVLNAHIEEPEVVEFREPDCDALAIEEPEDVWEPPVVEPPVRLAIEPAEPPAAPVTQSLPASIVEPPPVPAAVDFTALAQVCTEFSQVQDAMVLPPWLRKASEVLDAAGLIVWVWDPVSGGLRAAIAHGYSDRVLAHLPVVSRDDDNATAAAFRSAQVCSTAGGPGSSSAIVVPLQAAGGCAGVLAVELAPGREQDASVRAAAMIVAAMLAQLVVAPSGEEVEVEGEDASMLEAPRRHAVSGR